MLIKKSEGFGLNELVMKCFWDFDGTFTVFNVWTGVVLKI